MRQAGGRAFLYDATRHVTLAVPRPPSPCARAVWDASNAEVFVLAGDGGSLHVYRYEAQSTRGPRIVRLAEEPLSLGRPLLCRNGALTWCGEDGQLRHGVLSTHTALQVPPARPVRPLLGFCSRRLQGDVWAQRPCMRNMTQNPLS